MSKRCQIIKKMSNVKSQTHRLWRRFTKNRHNEFTHIDAILTSNMKVTKNVQKHFLCTFWGFWSAIICDVKIDINMCEPHYVNFFLWTSSIVMFDFLTFDIFLTSWHPFNNLTSFWHFDTLTYNMGIWSTNVIMCRVMCSLNNINTY